MKYLALLVIAFFLFVVVVKANTYYISSSQGNDSRTSLEAQNENTPWKTLSKLNTFFADLKPGDAVLFRRGDVFPGSLIVAKSGTTSQPIIFAAYGPGLNPVMTGLITLSNWNSAGNGIWQTACSTCDPNVNLLLMNKEVKEVGRYPNKNDQNKGYLTFESHSGTSEITDNQLVASPNWTGGEVVIRKKRWVIDKSPITDHSGNTITYSSTVNDYEPADNFGYFIQKHPLTLDQAGEWYFDKNTKVIAAHFGSNGPGGFEVETSVVNTIVSIKYQNHIVFDNIDFTGANANVFEILDAENIVVKNCSISFSGTNGISASGTDKLTIQNVKVENTFNNAFDLGPSCTNSQVIGNKIKNSGLFAGMGKNGDESYHAIIVRGSNNLVANNEIENTGYVAIRFDGSFIEIRNNFINYFDLVKDDGGGIYTYKDPVAMPARSNRIIKGNIILNGMGTSEGTDNPNDIHAAGIYIDDYSDNIDISGNTVAFCSSGIYIHNSNKINIRENSLYNNWSQALMVHDPKGASSPIRNMDVANNIFFCKKATDLAIKIESIKDDIPQFGRFDSNYYSRPISDNFVISTSYQANNNPVSQQHNLKSWQQAFGKDMASRETNAKIPTYILNSLNGNNVYGNGKFNSNIAEVSYYSPTDNCSVSWNNGGKLDGGALAVTFNNKQEGNISQIIVRVGEIISSKNYILRFSMLGTGTNRKLKVFLRNSFAPYNQLSEAKISIINPGRSENELLLSTTSGISNGCIVLELEDANEAIWFDNIELYDANVSFTNPEDYVRFEYNATAEPKNISLGNSYTDVKGAGFPGTIVLQPYTSAILLKRSETALPSTELEFAASEIEQGTELKWVIQNNVRFKYFEVEKSFNGNDFEFIGRIDYNGIANYKYKTEKPVPGNNFYRLKIVDDAGKHSYSKIILLKKLSENNLQIGPNPVNNLLWIYLRDRNAGQKANIVIQNISGITLKDINIDLSNQPLNVDVSSLTPGYYIIKIISDNFSANKSFIKR